MTTRRDDDYLICKHYYNHINNKSSEFPGFITFEHNDNHYFAWVHDDKVILRSEAYPDKERMIRGIKAVIKNRDIQGRYSIDSQHGAHFLVLWGGGDRQKHTGNMSSHNEIGRSCPTTNKDELYAAMLFMGKDFANGIFGKKSAGSTKGAAAIAAGTAAASSFASSKTSATSKATKGAVASSAKSAAGTAKTSAATASQGGGFKWWWLLPLLLLPLLFWWKGCGTDGVDKAATATSTAVSKTATEVKTAVAPKIEEATEIVTKAVEDVIKEEPKVIEKAAAPKKTKSKVSGTTNRKQSFKGNKNSGF